MANHGAATARVAVGVDEQVLRGVGGGRWRLGRLWRLRGGLRHREIRLGALYR